MDCTRCHGGGELEHESGKLVDCYWCEGAGEEPDHCESCGEPAKGRTLDDVPLCTACSDFEKPIEGRAP